jgi:hypothetical protein
MSHIIFMRIGCTLLICDMYMCRLRHINDPVLSSLKMEGKRFFLRRHMSDNSVSNWECLQFGGKDSPVQLYVERVSLLSCLLSV